MECGMAEDLLCRYVRGSITADEAQTVQRHLIHCKLCLDEVTALSKVLKQPATEAEKTEFQKLMKLNPEARLKKVMAKVDEVYGPVETEEKQNPSVVERVSQRLRALLTLSDPAPVFAGSHGQAAGGLAGWFESPQRIAGYAFAFAATVIVIAGAFWGTRYYQTGYRIGKAVDLVQENYTVYMADTPRLSGWKKSYGSTGVGVIMSGEPDDTSMSGVIARGDTVSSSNYLEQANQLIHQALAKGEKSVTAVQLLAQILIIEKKYDAADSLLRQLQPRAASATLLNDRGVFYFEQAKWDSAAHYFSAAAQADSGLAEAFYNLALAKDKLDQPAEAMSILDEYKKLETDIGWRNAAEEYYKRLKRSLDER
jgi:tetratricopeptide (TPR) repeat protein